MSTDRAIEGEFEPVAEQAPSQLPAERHSQLPANQPDPAAQQVFNPLDSDPKQFAVAVAKRQSNYDALREWLRGTLIPGKDFGKQHVMSKAKCDKGAQCTNPYHFSPNALWDPGADKVLSLMGLAASYPGEDDYRKAALRGIKLEDVIMKCRILDGSGRTIAEGSGAASTKEHMGSLNNTLKKAQKRARLDAVKRLPGVSSLFEDGYFDNLNPEENSYQARMARKQTDEQAKAMDNQGLLMDVMPMGKHKGKPFHQIDERYLGWIVENKPDMGDLVQSCKAELRRRALNEPAPKTEDEELDEMVDGLERRYRPQRDML